MMDFSLQGKRIIITGASTGIGAAAAKIMGALGARVLVAARSAGKLEAVAAAVTSAGGEGVAFAADMAREDDINALVDKANALWGGVDGVFANAGIGGAGGPFVDYALETFDQMMNVNLRSIFIMLKRVLPGMIAQGSGAIVCTGSLASERGFPFNPAYVVSKHGVLGLVRAVAAEHAAHNIRANCLLPGLIHTPMFDALAGGGDVGEMLKALSKIVPQGRVGAPEEAGAIAAFLLSDAARYVNGQALAVDGGVLGVQMT